MAADTLETCPKHGIQFNRAHYFECELCRGAHISTLTVESPIPDVWKRRLSLASVAIAGALVLYVGVALLRPKPVALRSVSGPAVVGLPCAQTCADHADECLSDCAAVREDSCSASCMPELDHCVSRCRPALHVRDGIAVIKGGPEHPGLDAAVQALFSAWPPAELPERAHVRLTINAATGTVRDVLAQATPGSAASVLESKFKAAVFPKVEDPAANEPGRHAAPAPYVVYLLMKP